MSVDVCYLLPIAMACKRPFCTTSRRSLSGPRRFIGDIVTISIGSAFLPTIWDATNSHTAKIYHLTEG